MKKICFITGIAIIAATLMFATSCKKKESGTPGITTYLVQPGGSLNGLSYSAWSASWWKWLMELPVEGNPSVDTVNFDVTAGQSGNVWFLAEPFTTLPVTRTCTIPAGKGLFVALLTAEASALEGLGTTDSSQLANAIFSADHIINLSATIDGITIGNLISYRAASPQFTFTAPTPWLYGATGGTSTSVGDGYYLMFRSLPTGNHTLHYSGEFLFTVANGGFDFHAYVNMTYNLKVQ